MEPLLVAASQHCSYASVVSQPLRCVKLTVATATQRFILAVLNLLAFIVTTVALPPALCSLPNSLPE